MTYHAVPRHDSSTDAPELAFWGVRGSIAVPGAGTLKFGGNTSCIEVKCGNARFIVDAGTGISPLGQSRGWQGDEPIHLLLTHLHHDHIIGLPFFRPIFQKGRDINIWCGNLDGATAEAAMAHLFAPPLFPFGLHQAPARFIFHGFKAGETLKIGQDSIRTVLLDHPSGATGYRFDTGSGSAVIVTDIEHRSGGPAANVVALCKGADTLVYDMMLDETEYGACQGWGHSTAPEGIKLANAAGVRQLVGFHHSPTHDDAMMQDREARLQEARASSLMAREGLRLVCSPSPALTTTR